METEERNKRVILDLVQVVWREGRLDRLPEFWAEDCVNHAAPPGAQRGLAALHDYHAQFGTAFAGFSDVAIDVVQQVADGQRVATHIVMTARHTGLFEGVAGSGRQVALAAMRIDRMQDGRIAEHWSVTDFAGLMRQIGEG